MRAVIDTVVFLRAAINPRSIYARLLAESGSSFQLVVSPTVLLEITEVLTRSELRDEFPRLDAGLLERVVPVISSATIVHPAVVLDVSRDPTDNKFFECAVAGGADYIISEDEDILDVGEYEGIKTVSAAEFLQILDDQAR
jgi:putative PIN family toxin of toxin-antitoxin system